ncbi:MAG TPA: glycerate kinase, partial [Bacillales bacterium]
MEVIMNVLVAPDSFKGSLTAKEAAQAMKKGIHKVRPE